MIPCTPYNKKKEYQTEIAPVIMELKELCSKHGIPMFFAAAYKNTEKETYYIYEMLMAASNRKLADNQIHALLLSINGFQIDYPEDVKEAISLLEHFLHRSDNVEHLDLGLTEDNFAGFEEIRNNAIVKLPTSLSGDDDVMDF